MSCSAKHTKYDPTIEEFNCPGCGAKAGEFCVNESPVESDPDCDFLHEEDDLLCYKCRYETTGKAFAKKVVKERQLVPCECCKGKGYVKAKK